MAGQMAEAKVPHYLFRHKQKGLTVVDRNISEYVICITMFFCKWLDGLLQQQYIV